MIKLHRTIHGAAALAAITLLAACQEKTNPSDTSAADVAQSTPATPPAAPTTTAAGEDQDERTPGVGVGDDGLHGPGAGMEMGREARERGMGMAPSSTPPSKTSPQ